jgi:UDP-N-acetylenolpyruvoylglucosamine reductase
VNTGSAKASEVYQLIQMIKQKAKKTLGLELQEEIHYLGKF